MIDELKSYKLYRQSNVVRWQLRDFHFYENDSEHQLFVTQIVVYLIHKYKIDNATALAAIKYAAVHDYPESCSGLGDVNYKVKEDNPELKALVKQREHDAMKAVPAFYQAKKCHDNNELAQLVVSLADAIDAHLYAERESRYEPGNEWKQLADETKQRVDSLQTKLEEALHV